MEQQTVDITGLFDKYYSGQRNLRNVVWIHSEQVARKALDIINRLKLPVDREFVYCGAMLHDIGVVCCNAPDIGAFGSLPYICHGTEGRRMLEEEGLSKLALICERHTGSGLTCKQIEETNLPIPHRDMLPLTLEEKLICYADKFFSKSGDLYEEKPLQKIVDQLSRHGNDTVSRFLELHELFRTRNTY